MNVDQRVAADHRIKPDNVDHGSVTHLSTTSFCIHQPVFLLSTELTFTFTIHQKAESFKVLSK